MVVFFFFWTGAMISSILVKIRSGNLCPQMGPPLTSVMGSSMTKMCLVTATAFPKLSRMTYPLGGLFKKKSLSVAGIATSGNAAVGGSQ